jgi:glycosyltransferase involved in cell wall biosynthesis
MKIIGLIDKGFNNRQEWNGEAIRSNKAGASGTDQSFVLVGEYLARMGHEVYLSFGKILSNTSYNGVKYIDNYELKKISNEFDILIIPSGNNEFIEYNWTNLKKLVVWCHYQGYIHPQICAIFKFQYPTCKVYTNRMAKFVIEYLEKFHTYYDDFSDFNFEIENPLMLDMFKNNILKEKYSFVFFASYERGGEIAMNAYKKMQYPNKRMYFTSPDTDELNRKDITFDIIPIRWSDKKSTFQLLSKMEYFIYPLALPSRRGYQFHKDTDGLVVAESLLHEVIVITYPVGALKEKYGDHLIYLPFPPNVDTHILEGPDQISVPEFHSEFVLESIIKTVEFLENNPNLKEIIKKRGKEFILNKKEPTQIGNEWLKNLHLI